MPTPKFSIDNLKQASGITQQTTAPTPRAAAEPQKPSKPLAERLGAYLTHDEYQAMRAAYMADIDNLSTGPDSLGEWVARAVEDHARKSPERRTRAAKHPDSQVPSTGPDGDKQQMKSWPATATTHAQIHAAMSADRAAGFPGASVSRWTADAIRIAIADARKRNGGTLPPPPEGRTPKRPRR